MNRPLLAVAAIVPLFTAACVGPGKLAGGASEAVADLVDAQGQPAGRAVVRQSADGLWLDVTASRLTPGAHGLHVHAAGNCALPDFVSAGPHWNPTAHEHGRKNPKGTHAGDAPNLIADADGRGQIKTWLGAGSLTAGTAPLLDADGAAVVIHADPDDEMTDPSGKSGKRILCGVLRAR